MKLQAKAAIVVVMTAAFATANPVWAQKLGAGPIRIVAPSSAGSATDLAARALSDKLSAALEAPVIIENKPGAQGRIAIKYALDAPADGHTLYVFSAADTAAPALIKDYPFDTQKVFAPVAPLAHSPNILVVSPSLGIKSVKELVEAAKAKPQSMSFASVGPGSASFMNGEKFKRSAGITLIHVPFKGGGEATTEVIAGRVSMFFGSLATVLPHIKSGKLLALAMGTDSRAPQLPDVPTLAEAGVPNAAFTFWIGLVAAANTPQSALGVLADAVAKAMADRQVQQRFEDMGYAQMQMSRQQFASFIAGEAAANAALIRESGFKPE